MRESLRDQLVRIARFGVAGVFAAGVDMAVLQGAVALGLDLYSGRVASYLAAATAAWILNRQIAFADRKSDALLPEWLRYLAANSLGGLVNYAVYAALVTVSALFATYPFLAVAAGSLSGLLVNFNMSQQFVFGRR